MESSPKGAVRELGKIMHSELTPGESILETTLETIALEVYHL